MGDTNSNGMLNGMLNGIRKALIEYLESLEEPDPVVEASDLSPVKVGILRDLYERGDNLPKAIANSQDHHSKSVSRSLSKLKEMGLVERKNEYGVWTLTEEGERKAETLLLEELD